LENVYPNRPKTSLITGLGASKEYYNG